MIFYPRYPGDYLRDTGHLSIVDHGVYNLLLDVYYSTEKPLPLEENAIFRLVRASKRSEKSSVLNILNEFWVRTNDGWINERAAKEIAKARKKSEVARDSARSRWNADAMQTHSERNADAMLPRTIPITTSKKTHPDSSSSSPQGSQAQPPKSGVCVDDEMLSQAKNLWNDMTQGYSIKPISRMLP